ncbi:hypothetical protein TNCV_4631091 [Trichonephila clavipes]|nr:hypothetical protein TNCV_4631091 [Trichonephila clavipes]
MDNLLRNFEPQSRDENDTLADSPLSELPKEVVSTDLMVVNPFSMPLGLEPTIATRSGRSCCVLNKIKLQNFCVVWCGVPAYVSSHHLRYEDLLLLTFE